MTLKVVSKAAKVTDQKPKKKLKVVATEPEVDPEEPEVETTVPAKVDRKKGKKDKAVSTSKVEAEVVDSAGLIEETRVSYRTFQVSWFAFAKNLKTIRDTEAWIAAGHDDFSSLCRDEFPAVPAATISKFIKVVEEFGMAIEARFKTTKELPAYDALYEVAINEKKIPKEDAMRLRKAVVECKVSVREVRDVVRGLISDKKETKHTAGRLEKRKQRNEELGIKDAETKEVVASDEDVEVDENEAITSSVDKDADTVLKYIRFLISRVPAITESMSEGTNKLIELAEAIEEVQVPLNEFLDRLESVSNV